MMKKHVLLLMFAFALVVTSLAAGQKSARSVLDNMNVVATKTNVRNTGLITCDLTKLKDTVYMPLSELVEDIHLVKLDGKDEALVSEGATLVTANYILVRNNKQNPFKLFTRKGKFLTTIGSYGKGPNEYLNVYDEWLDEKTKRIYILPWQSDKVLVFDFTGKALTPIPLPCRVPKGRIYIDPEKSILSVVQLPFGNNSSLAWSQYMDGKVIKTINANHLSIKPDFSNELSSNGNTAGFDFFLFTFFELRPDTLYHFDYDNNQLRPKFTMNFKNKPIKIHWYEELPRHFMGEVTVEVQLSETVSTTAYPSRFIVDKQTLKGAFYKLYNNYLGNSPISWASFSNGYYVRNVDPGQLMHEISEQLKNKTLSEKQRQGLTKLLDSIDENDNNYVMYGKLKK